MVGKKKLDMNRILQKGRIIPALYKTVDLAVVYYSGMRAALDENTGRLKLNA